MGPRRDPDPYVSVGRVRRPWGVRGDVLVESWSDVEGRFAQLDEVRCVLPGGASRVLRAVGARRMGPGDVLHFAGVDDRTAAEALVGGVLEVPRAASPALPPGRYYVADVVGLEVVTEDGRRVGRVTDVMQPGAHDVYVVEGERGEVLLPAIPDVIREVDVAAGRLVVRLLPGLEGQ